MSKCALEESAAFTKLFFCGRGAGEVVASLFNIVSNSLVSYCDFPQSE